MGTTMKELAEMLGISINAVSLALNNKPGVSDSLRFKVLNLAQKSGYLAKRARYVKTYTQTNLCVFMQKMYSNDMSYYGKVLYAVTEKAQKIGFDTLIHFFNDRDFVLPNSVKEYRVSGIVIIGKISDQNIAALQEYEIPTVIVDHASLQRNMNCVVIDNKLGGYLAANYIIEKKIEKIGFFGDLDYSISIKERYFGFREALSRQKGLSPRELDAYVARYSVLHEIEVLVLNNDIDAIGKIMGQRELPSAFVCSNDYAAIALMTALQNLGYRIPQDISIIGFDNIDVTEKVSPRITTVNVDKRKMGSMAVERIKTLIDSPDEAVISSMLGVQLVERDSVI